MLSYVVYIILYCNDDWHVKDSVVHRSHQQSLVAKWLGLCVYSYKVRVRARAMEWNYFCFFFFPLCLKVMKTFVMLSWHVTVRRSRRT